MKVLYFTSYPSPYTVAFCQKLGKGCNLTVLFDDTIENQKHRDTRWFNTSYNNFNAVFLKQKYIGNEYHFSSEIIYWLKKDFDIILIGLYSALTAQLAIIWMKLHRKNFFIKTDGGFAKDGKGFIEKWKKFLISSAIGWFSPSEASDKYLCFYGALPNKIIRYPFTSLFQSDQIKCVPSLEEKRNLKKVLNINEEKMILAVGQFIPGKGNDIIIKAAKKFPSNTGLYIIGGKAPNEYLKLVKKLKLNNVHFLDFKVKEELKNYYKAADIFVFPTRKDAWGLVLNEALAYGLPAIASNKAVSTLELIKENENGYIMDTEDENIWANKIINLLKYEDICRSMGEKSIKLMKNYSIERMVEIHLNTFRKYYNLKNK